MEGIRAVVEHAGLVAAVENAVDGILITDIRGRIEYANPAFLRVTGYSREEVVGQTPQILKSGKQSSTFYEELWEKIGSGEIWHGEVVNRRKDGSLYREEMRVTPLRGEGDDVVGYMAIKHDITEHFNEVKAQRLLAAIVEGTDDAIFAYTAAGTVLSWNLGAEAVFGYTSDEVVGKDVSMLVAPERQAGLAELIAYVMQGNTVPQRQGVGVHKDGHRIYVCLTSCPIRDGAGDVTAISVVLRDITDKRESEHARALLASIVEFSADAIHSVTLDGTIASWNQSSEDLFGYTKDEVIGKSAAEVLAPPGRSEELFRCLEVIRGGGFIRSFETVLQGKGRRLLDVSLSVSPVRSRGGEVIGASGLVRDIAPRLKAQRMLRESEERFRGVFQYAPFGMCVVGMTGRIMQVNDAMCRITGYSEQELLATAWAELDHPGEAEPTVSTVCAMLKDAGGVVDWERQYRHREGRPVWARVRASTIQNGAGNGDGTPYLVFHVEDVTAQKQAEREVHDSREFAQATIDALSSHICVLDETGTIVAVNQAWRNFAASNGARKAGPGPDAANRDECLGCPTFGVGGNYLAVCDRTTGPEAGEAAEFAAGIRAVLSGAQATFSKEYPCNSFTERRWFLSRITRFSTGGMPRVVIEHINISERKRAEDALIESESRFRLMADGCPSMIWAVNAKGETQFVNRAYREFFGETYKRVVDGDWWLVIHPEDALEFVPAFERAVREQKPFSHEVRLKRADGEWRWAASYGEPRFSPSGEYLGLVGLCPDITTRKEAEQALQRSEEKFRQLAENIREVFWVQSLTPGEESYVSPAYESMWGRSCESFYRDPRSWAEAIHPDDRERAVAAFADDVRAESVETEYRIRTPRGEEKWIRDRAFPVYNESGRRIRMVGVAEEITHHKRYEAELVRAREGADAANQAKSRFLANMSHEIRTPMNGVIGMLQLLQGTDLTEEQRRFADVAQSSGRTLLALVDDILDLSKIEARKITIENRRFNLRELVEGVVQLLSVQASEKGQYVRWCVAPEIPDYVRGDAHRLRQILNNLMSNAIKFTGRGTIDLSAELVSIDDVKTTLRFEVRDTGIGLSEGQIATLFSPFVQADTSTTRRYGGTGLGLAICKQLAEMMGGQIGVKSREREGSTFWFTAVLGRIALEEQVASVEDERLLGSLLLAVPEAHVGTGHLGHGERILVAEDNLTNVEVIVALLQKLGYQVDAVGNGADAVVAVGCGKYDLVLMDCEMPMMDGYEATARIRASTRPDVPIVALTADAMPADRERCLAAGMNDYLAKPVELARLAAVLIRWVTGERERADSRKTNSRAEADSAVPNAKEAVLQREVFDEVALLRRLMGDRELAGTVLKGFLGDLPAQLVRLRARIDGGDETGARLLVHTLKGSSATVGAAALHAVAMRMEAEDAEPWLSHCQNLLTCVEQEVVRFQGSVKNRGWV